MPFTLNYTCSNCGHQVPTKTTDGGVHPPPDFCINCSVIGDGVKRRTRREAGDIVLGLELIVYSKAEKTWRVQCLFCREYALVKNNNIGVQKSCGCLKGSTLTPICFNLDHTVECDCRECGLRSVYSLLAGAPITCKSGCI